MRKPLGPAAWPARLPYPPAAPHLASIGRDRFLRLLEGVTYNVERGRLTIYPLSLNRALRENGAHPSWLDGIEPVPVVANIEMMICIAAFGAAAIIIINEVYEETAESESSDGEEDDDGDGGSSSGGAADDAARGTGYYDPGGGNGGNVLW